MIKNNLYDLLSNRNLVAGTNPPVTDFCGHLDNNKSLKIVYGETYDGNGMTIDSLKYYFFVSLVHKILRENSFGVNSIIIIGDTASVLNNSVSDNKPINIEIKSKEKKIGKLKKIYGLGIETKLMSDLMDTENFKKNKSNTSASINSSPELLQMAEKTIIKNKLSEEREKEFDYTTDEVTLISDFDIKIGPPRERYYDEIARKVNNKKINGIYLKPTYPLGLSFDYFICHKEIEEFGLTPYKAGSNRLNDNRIIIGKTTQKQLEDLINNSFVSPNSNLPNPVFDLLFISEMAKSFLNKTEFNFKMLPLFSFDTLGKKAYTQIIKYIFEPLKNGGFYE